VDSCATILRDSEAPGKKFGAFFTSVSKVGLPAIWPLWPQGLDWTGRTLGADRLLIPVIALITDR